MHSHEISDLYLDFAWIFWVIAFGSTRFLRFYEYDFLRGFYFLEKWRQQSGFSIPDDLVDEVEELVSRQMTDQGIRLKRYNLFDRRSYNPSANGTWVWGDASEIDLMKTVSFEGSICQPLTKK